MPEQDMDDMLKDFETQYDEAVPAAEDKLPEGEYQFTLHNAELTMRQDKNTGDSYPCVILSLQCIAPGFEEYSQQDWNHLKTGKAIGFWKDKLKILKVDVNTKLSDLEPALKEVLGTIIRAKVVHNAGWVNLRFVSNEGKDESFVF